MNKINYLAVLIILAAINFNGCKSTVNKQPVNQQAYNEALEINRQSVDTRKLLKDLNSLKINLDNINNAERLSARKSETDKVIGDLTTWKKSIELGQSKFLQALNGGSESDSLLHCQYFNESEQSKIVLKQIELLIEETNLYKTFFASFANPPKTEEFLAKAEELKIKQEAKRIDEAGKSLGQENNKLQEKLQKCSQYDKKN